MGDGSRSKARFVGEDATGDAFLHAHKEGSDHAACDGRRVKCPVNNRRKYGGNPVNIEKNHAEGEHDIEQRHKGNQFLRHASDSFDSAEKDQAHQSRQNDSDDKTGGVRRTFLDQMVIEQRRVDCCCDGVYLSGIACSEHGEDAEGRKQSGQPAPVFPETVLYVVHGTAY